jgi:hypothetical protein
MSTVYSSRPFLERYVSRGEFRALTEAPEATRIKGLSALHIERGRCLTSDGSSRSLGCEFSSSAGDGFHEKAALEDLMI